MPKHVIGFCETLNSGIVVMLVLYKRDGVKNYSLYSFSLSTFGTPDSFTVEEHCLSQFFLFEKFLDVEKLTRPAS